MLLLDLFYDRQRNRFLAGLNSEQEAVLPVFPQFDTVALAVHNVVRNTDDRASLYVERPWSFTSIRASLTVKIDGPPDTGSVCWKVGDEVSEPIVFTADLSAATATTQAAWKTAAVAKLKAMSNVGAEAVQLTDPPNTPFHFFYLTWTDDEDERVIELAANKLAPICVPEVKLQRPKPGYQQLVKLVQAPLILVPNFVFPGASQPTVSEKRGGQVGQNEVQRLTIPDDAQGSLELKFSGAPTSFLTVPGVTAEAIAAALNALVPDGETDPSFAVTTINARTFDIEFIGPEAATAQAALVATIYPSAPPMVATGLLPLTSPVFERPLNGAKNCKLQFELVIRDVDGESKIVREVTFVNAATAPSIEAELEEAGAVLVRETTVFINVTEGGGEPIATVAPGVAVSPGEVGSNFVISHGLDTWHPATRVAYKISADPEQWVNMPDDQYEARAISEASVRFTFPVSLSDDEEDPLYFGNYKFFIVSPDAQVQLIEHTHTWAQVRESLPDGQTLAAKLLAIDAALGVFGGTLQVNASNIVGQLAAGQIDLGGVGTALKTETKFLETLRELVKDTALIENIGTGLQSSVTFFDTFKNLIVRQEVVSALSPQMLANNAFVQQMRTLIVSIIQGTAGALGDTAVWELPAIDEAFPALVGGLPQMLPKAVFLPTSLGTLTSRFVPRAKASNVNSLYVVGADGAYLTPNKRKVFNPGDVIYNPGGDWFLADVCTLGTFTADASTDTITVNQPHFRAAGDIVRVTTTAADLPDGLAINTDYYVLASGLTANAMKVSATAGGSAIDITDAGTGTHTMVTGAYYASEFERELFTIHVNDQQLVAGTRFALLFNFTLSIVGNCEASYWFTLLRGTANAERVSRTNLSTITTDETVTNMPLVVTDAKKRFTFGYAVECAANGDLSATRHIETKADLAATAPASRNFTVRGFLSRFDPLNVAAPRGQLKLTMPSGQIASIVALEED